MTDTTTEEPVPEWLTVAEAARRLNIDAKQVRRYAGRLSEADRTPAGQVPLRVRLASLLAQREAGGSAPKTSTKAEDRTGHPAGQGHGTGQDPGKDVPPVEGTLPAIVYQKLLADKDGEIDYLRGQLRLAQENLAREQLLRLNITPESGWMERAGPDVGHAAGQDTGQGQDTAEEAQAGKRPWWGRLWKSG